MISIHKSLNEKIVLITGVTGFLGKVFLHNLLCKIPEIKKVYVIIRGSDHANVLSRFQNELTDSKIFINKNDIFKKVIPIKGDICELNLGITDSNILQQMLIEVDVIINVAASINFFEPIDVALNSNYNSVKNIINFCKKSFKAKLLHISTCFVCGKEHNICTEKIYEPSNKFAKNLPMLKNNRIDLDALEKILLSENIKEISSTQDLKTQVYTKSKNGKKISNILGWHDIYTLTKWMGEQYIDQKRGTIQCSIVRPSIITSTLLDIGPGWIEGFKVIDPLIYLAGSKKIKHFAGSSYGILDLIPADVVANIMICALAELLSNDDLNLKIYNASSGDKNSVSIKQLYEYTVETYNLNKTLIPFIIPKNLYIFSIKTILALLFVVNKIYKNNRFRKVFRNFSMLNSLTEIFACYTTIRTKFPNENVKKLFENIKLSEKEIFHINTDLNWKEYITKIHIPGLMENVIYKNDSVTNDSKS